MPQIDVAIGGDGDFLSFTRHSSRSITQKTFFQRFLASSKLGLLQPPEKQNKVLATQKEIETEMGAAPIGDGKLDMSSNPTTGLTVAQSSFLRLSKVITFHHFLSTLPDSTERARATTEVARMTADTTGSAAEEVRLIGKQWSSSLKSLPSLLANVFLPDTDWLGGANVPRKAVAADVHQFWALQEEAEARARLKALRENDTEAYLQHLNIAKVGSLLRIMEITHDFMTKIGAELDRHQTGNSHTGTGAGGGARAAALDHLPLPSGVDAANKDYQKFQSYVASAKDEYRLVHKKQCFVATQPAALQAELMPHQMVGLRFLASLFVNGINGILADEMGVGKTIQTLAFLLYLKESLHVSGPHLVMAPLSIIREWREACAQFVPSFRVCEFGTELTNSHKRPEEFDIVLMAVHRVRNADAALWNTPWSFLVVDEAHKSVSNLKTLTAQAILSIPFKHRLVLTGTPLNSDLQELWSLLHFINPQIFHAKDSFDEVFRRPFLQHGVHSDCPDVALTVEEQALLVMRMHQILRPFLLRRTKKDIDMTLRISFHEVRCPLTYPQQFLLQMLRDHRQLPHFIEGRAVPRTVLTIESSAQMVCNHAFLVPFFSQLLHFRSEGFESRELFEEEMMGDGDVESTNPEADDDDGTTVSASSSEIIQAAPVDENTLPCVSLRPPVPKLTPFGRHCADAALSGSGKLLILDLILRRARHVKQKVVLFTHWLDMMDLLREYFASQEWPLETYVVLDGSSTAEERKAAVDSFRSNPDCLIFLVSMKAGGCGLNLQVAHFIIMLDRDYTGTNEDQAIARVFRIGQKHIVRALYLVTEDPSEQRIAHIAERKDKPRLAVIEGGGYHVDAAEQDEETRRKELEKSLQIGQGPADVYDLSSGELYRAAPSTMFDGLLVPIPSIDGSDMADSDKIRAALAQCPHESRRGCFSKSELHPVLEKGIDEVTRVREEGEQEECGRGKRARQETSADDCPPTPFWEALADEGFDDDEIQRRWIAKRDEATALEKAADVSFDAVAPMGRRTRVTLLGDTVKEELRRFAPPKIACLPMVGSHGGNCCSSWSIPRVAKHKDAPQSSAPSPAAETVSPGKRRGRPRKDLS